MVFNYWGKADPVYPHEQKWHPLVYHSLDVAAVGVTYLEQSSLLKSCCGLLNCTEPDFLSWAGFVLALHDLGKFSEAFQAQRSDLILELQKREPNTTKIYNERHDSLGFWLWNEHLVDEVLQRIGIDDSRNTQRSLKCWLLAVTGHHGMPPKPSGNAHNYFRKEDMQTAAEFVQTMAALLLTKDARYLPANKNFKIAGEMLSWWFAGTGSHVIANPQSGSVCSYFQRVSVSSAQGSDSSESKSNKGKSRRFWNLRHLGVYRVIRGVVT